MNQAHPYSPTKSWLICLSAALFFLYVFFQLAMFNTISSDILDAYHLTSTRLGYLSSGYFFADALAIIPAGLLLDRFSTRRICLTVMLACVIATFSFASTDSFSIALLAHATNGIGNAVAFLASMKLASRWLPQKRLALGVGLIVTTIMVGGYIAQAPFEFLVNSVGWRHAVMIDACFGSLIFIYMLIALKDHPLDKESKPEALFDNLILAIKNPQNWYCAFYTSFMNLAVSLLGELWGVMYLVEAHHLKKIVATEITGMIFVGMIFGPTLLGWLSDFLQRRRLPMFIATILILLDVFLITYTHVHSVLTLNILFFFLGLLASAQVLSYPTIAESNPPAITSTSMSIVAITFNLVSFLAQPLFGLLMHLNWDGVKHAAGHPMYAARDFNVAMIILPIALIISFFLVLLIKETFCRRRY